MLFLAIWPLTHDEIPSLHTEGSTASETWHREETWGQKPTTEMSHS